MMVIPGQITLTFCYLAEGRGGRFALKCLGGPCLDNSACKLNDPTILGDRRAFRHGLADLNSIIKGTWVCVAQLHTSQLCMRHVCWHSVNLFPIHQFMGKEYNARLPALFGQQHAQLALTIDRNLSM